MLVERFNFNELSKQPGRLTIDFLGCLKLATRNFEYRDLTEELIHDKLVSTYPDKDIQQMMMSEADFSLQNLERIAKVIENSQRRRMLIDKNH